MSKTVIDSVREKCRNALKAHIPIVYIKTDSTQFIKKLLESSPALVARIWSDGNSERKKSGELADSDKKFNVVADSISKTNINNYAISTNESFSGKEIKLHICENPSYPFIHAYQITENATFSDLMSYILRHENPADESYDVLQNSLVILYSSQVYLDPNLLCYTDIIDPDYPDEYEIKNLIISESDNFFNIDDADNYSGDLLGLDIDEITILLRKMATVDASDNERTERTKDLIYAYKKKKMESGCLVFCKKTDNEIAGMGAYTEWLNINKDPIIQWHEYEKTNGTPPPKGVLFCGIPGCGKSAAAKFTAKELGINLVKLDIGSLMDKYQGVAEQRMRQALTIAEAVSPCVLWIDELEKAFSGAGENEDSSAFKRMFGYLLGWMQDNDKPCFIFATANNIGGLPKEFFRSGRIDECFAVYLPLEKECTSIFKAIMKNYEDKKAKRKIFETDCYNDNIYSNIMNSLVDSNERPRIIIGSDIEKSIQISLRKLKKNEAITKTEWEKELCESLKECTVYGDSEENIDSIAASYCRLLRKGMKPVSANVLFKNSDYHINNYNKLKQIIMQQNSLSAEEYHKKMEENGILQSAYSSESAYNNAMHKLLKERINSIAPDIEEYERKLLIRT